MNGLLMVALALAWFAIPCLGWLIWQLLRQNGGMLLRLEELERRLDELEFGEAQQQLGLPVDSPAPEFELTDLDGQPRTLAQHRGQPLLLIFFNPDCGFCRELMPKLREKLRSVEGTSGPVVLIVSTGGAEANRRIFEEHKITQPVLLQKQMEVATAYQANGTPSGCLISGDGRIASELALGAEALLQLIEGKNRLQTPGAEPPTGGSPSGNGHERADRFRKHSLARSKIKRDGLKAGTPAPDFSLPRLDGRGELTLANLRGRQVLLVFSSPSCGPCLALVSELEKFYREHLEIALVMISKGEPGENRAKVKEHDLTFPIVLQQQWEISRRYAMFGTPVGYLLDEQGLILHDAAVGTDAIRELMLRAAEGARPRLELAAG